MFYSPFHTPDFLLRNKIDLAKRDRRQWTHFSLEILSKCDVLLAIAGWENSVGAATEVGFALGRNIPIFYNAHEFVAWCNRDQDPSTLIDD